MIIIIIVIIIQLIIIVINTVTLLLDNYLQKNSYLLKFGFGVFLPSESNNFSSSV